ncbi:tyrosine-protein kinase receptor torso-like isoform X5 [Oscarella lobularis]|uniref:tyrosine-protein kinase receptor torso-like isoform X5 n=1 Tax=Oscarella lobularis TaxID=121494 RepID=UPI003313BF6A
MKRIGRHPHIVCMLACITAAQPLSLIVEYCGHGDLLSFLQRRRVEVFLNTKTSRTSTPSLSECDGENENEKGSEEEEIEEECIKEVTWELTPSDLLSFAWQIASGMEYLCGNNLVHRDLACRNVLIGDNKILKVSDFGLTKAVYEDGAYNQKTARRLPFRWMSVEAIIHRLFSEKSDVWSYGVVLWEIVTLGCFPYPFLASKDLLFHLRSGNRLECPENCSRELYEIMFECWRSEPEMRPTFEKLSTQLGKMLEEETPTKYLNLDSIYMSSFCDLKSTTGKRQSGSASSEKTDDALGALDDAPSDGADVRQRRV